jgi:hypothetical protein
MAPLIAPYHVLIRCFKTAYTDHCNTKHPPVSSRNADARRMTPTKNILGDSNYAAESEISEHDQYSGLDEDQWVANGSDKEYVPVAEDIGCILKVSLTGK